jgi:molecular chaperone DnaK
MKIVIYDLGGGTFDVSILKLGKGIFEVMSTSGDTHLGGDDFDQAIIDYLIDDFYKQEHIDLRNDRVALQRLKDAAEKAKINLSTLDSVEITLQFIAVGKDGPKHLQTILTRDQLEHITKDIAERTAGPCEKALDAANLKPSEIDEVVLVGGQTKMPLVRNVVQRIFRKEPYLGLNPDEAVAAGAAKQASVLKGDIRDILLLDVTAFSLGLKTEGGIFSKIIDKNSSIPTRKSDMYTNTIDNQSFVRIEVYQGEKPMAADNKMIGTFDLMGIPPGKAGTAKISVMFDIDANGIIKVSAKDEATGKEQAIKITPDSGLSGSEVDKMKKDIGEEFSKKMSANEKLKAPQDYREEKSKGAEGLPGELDSRKKASIFDIFKKKER